MEVIPAIDILGGKCVRLTNGDFNFKKIYSSDPLKIARLFQKAGLKKLHLIDLEGAKEGKIKNWATIEKIARNTGLLLQVGGGLRREQDAKRLLKLGPRQITLGTVAVLEPEKLKKFLRKFGREKVVVDAAVRNKAIYCRGWQKKTRKSLTSFLKHLVRIGVKTVVLTDISRDGTLRGPNFSLYKTVVSEFPQLEIIASGGIRSVQDLKKLAQTGVSSAIVGRALYEKKILLKDLKSFGAMRTLSPS